MTSEGENSFLRIQDLVEIPEIRTVIQLEDLKDPGLRRMIVETFVLTAEILDNLKVVFSSLTGHEGRGIFLKGHFGSGKSHFLSMLSQLLKYPNSWKTIVAQSPELKDFEAEIATRQFLVIEISLVQHRGSEFLEDIVLRAVFRTLEQQAGTEFGGADTRHETFLKLKSMLAGKGIRGIIFLIDELSEFLRSKADVRAYNEDIRFLQYLGEEASSFPFWVIASLQEWIEETGEIHQETFNKIKDRYRIRLNLGRAHIEELVSERLIRHKHGAKEKIGELFDDLKSYFPQFPVTRERFVRLYPVHPATSTLLDRLKPLFSEHRGVVDFIHFRLKGDPERRIPAMLDRPANGLLTPEVIFDHFLERIRERSESQIYIQRVFESYQDEIPEIFQDRDQQKVALSAVKLLILFSISPAKFKYTVRHMAEMLLFQITPMEADINYRFLSDILARLADEGSYIRVKSKDDLLDNHYFIDLKADIAGIMRRQIRHMASQLFSEDRRLFWKTAALVDSPYLPLGSWVAKGRQSITVNWQHTQRQGTLLLRQLDELSRDEVEGLARQCTRSEEDFVVVVGTAHNRDQQFRHVTDQLLPQIREHHGGTFLFWVPAEPEEDTPWLKEILAAILVQEQTDHQASEKKEQGHDFLQSFLERGKSRLIEHFSHCYYHGILFWDENRVELSRFGYLSQEKFLSEFIPPLLRRRFPRHSRIQPYMDTLAPGILKEMLNHFFSSGILIVDAHSKFGIRDVLEGLLKPMGLVKRKGNQYELRVNPQQNELVRHFFKEMGHRDQVSVEEMYWVFRKGEYGLIMPLFEILILALVFSGHLVAYKGKNRINPDRLAQTGIKGVTRLGKGEVLGEPFHNAVTVHPMIPGKYKNVPMTMALQEDIWSEIKEKKPAVLEDLETLKSRVKWAMQFEAFKNIPWDGFLKDSEDVKGQWDEVKVSLSSREGLERFLNASQVEPFLENKLKSIEECTGFLEHAERVLFIYQYITHPKLHLPDKEKYALLRQSRSDMLSHYEEKPGSVSPEALERLFATFQDFQESYIRRYTKAHHRARGEGPFESYEQMARSFRYRLLARLDKLEMISVEHNRRSVEQSISSVLFQRCLRSPNDDLQGRPVCSCGFLFEEMALVKPLKEIEKEIDLGINETIEALKASAIQEKILPYLESLELVGKDKEAKSIRRLLNVSADTDTFLEDLDQALTAPVARDINEAFRGKVVVVKRDLDHLYQSLVHRKYTLAQVRKIIQDWLDQTSITEDTFLHFLGKGEAAPGDQVKEDFRKLLDREFGSLSPLYAESGHDQMVKATITSVWARQYDIPFQKILEIFPFLQRGAASEDERRVRHLADLARTLMLKKPSLFDALVSQVEEDISFILALWTFLSHISPEQIFQQESLLSVILKEAFDRILCEKPEKKKLEKAMPSGEDVKVQSVLFSEKKDEMLRALDTCNLVREKGSALRSVKEVGPEDYSRWESSYVSEFSQTPYLHEKLQAQLKHIGSEIPPFIKKEIASGTKRLNDVTEQFRQFYRASLPIWEGRSGTHPTMIQDIPSILTRKRGVPDHREIRYILMDGMRWDLWEKIKSDFFEKKPNLFRVVKEGVLWSNQPSDTQSQLARLDKAFEEIQPELDRKSLLWKIGGIDEKIHTEKGPLPHLFGNIINYLEIDLFFRLKKLPSRTLLILFADHGFVENPAFDRTRKYEAPRYTHGKDSPFEVIVPWVWVMRI